MSVMVLLPVASSNPRNLAGDRCRRLLEKREVPLAKAIEAVAVR